MYICITKFSFLQGQAREFWLRLKRQELENADTAPAKSVILTSPQAPGVLVVCHTEAENSLDLFKRNQHSKHMQNKTDRKNKQWHMYVHV